jgi:mRNA interferase HicA
MNGHEFERKIRNLGRKRGVAVSFDPGHGRGSHGRLYYGTRFTTLKDRRKEIGPGLLKAMLDQLGVTKKDLEGR